MNNSFGNREMYKSMQVNHHYYESDKQKADKERDHINRMISFVGETQGVWYSISGDNALPLNMFISE